MKFAQDFQTIVGRNLVGELKNFVHRPFLLCTMEDMWPKFSHFFDEAEFIPYFVHSVDEAALLADLGKLPHFEAVVGLGGGMAVDTAKFFVWKKRVPLFQIQTALSMNASWGQRAGIRMNGVVRYIGWAVPEAVYIDYDVLRAAPRHLNYSGIGDILCNHTGILDWRYATAKGYCETKWPFDENMAALSTEKFEAVLRHRNDIRDLTDKGIEVLIDGLQHGTSYHGSGWNPRHIEGIDHFFFYTLEYLTGKKFLHGQPVCLGVYIGSLLHNARAGEMLQCMHDIGFDIRPEAMGVTWNDAAQALFELRDYVREKGLWYSIAHDTEITQEFVDQVRHGIESVYGPWKG
ncbi:MAG: iron-containing alcohol dehydrogenase [Pseudomonadota bacterium]|nr:iron-containing alcohol dehydrogenase [Pseudomonadota bacterium]